jgi:glycine oxidase
MPTADSPALPSGQSSAALLIVGGGIMGLWAAVFAERMGIDTVLIDAGTLGQGASAGLIGALMPHTPDQWNAKKQFQFEALVALEAEVARLEAETGLQTGYRRSGRLIPLPKPHLRQIAIDRAADADVHWQSGERRFHWNVVDAPPVVGWPDVSGIEGGFVHDTLAGRVAPRSLVAVLVAFVRNARHVRVIENSAVAEIDFERCSAITDSGTVAFGHCIIAAGHRSFPMLARHTHGLTQPLGQPVKGQSALLKADVDPSLPTIFRDGLYVIAHEGGHVAIGSTSENRFDEPYSTDDQLDVLLKKARALVPGLGDAPVIERWAGLRPKAIDRDPMIGPHPVHANLLALTGGFKVSFGLAHRLAEAVVTMSAGGAVPFAVPESFLLASHIRVASR